MSSERYVGTPATRAVALLSALVAAAIAVWIWLDASPPALVWLRAGCVLLTFVALLGAIHSFRFTYRAWMAFAERLHKVATIVLFGAIYLVVVPPFAIIAWWLDPLQLRPARGDSTYWVKKKHEPPGLEMLQRMS
jgi:hypothetical protein